MYRIHPALPGYLAARWRAEEPDAATTRSGDAATQALATAYAAVGRWLNEQIESGDAGLAYAVIGLQRRPSAPCSATPWTTSYGTNADTIAGPLEATGTPAG